MGFLSALPAIGSVLQGVGAVAGAFKSGDKGPSMQEQSAATLGHERDSLNQSFNLKMDLAKQHGLHPLTVLGVPTGSFTPAVNVGGSSGPDYAQLGYGANQIARSFVKPPEEVADPLDLRAKEANVRLLEAQAKRAEWDALYSEFKTADYAAPQLLTGQPGNPPGARISNDAVEMAGIAAAQSGLPPSLFMNGGTSPLSMKQEVLPPHPSKLGHGAATDQAHITVMGADGKPASLLNQNAIQAEFNDGATMTLLTRMFGVDRAVEIMAAMEQKGLIGGTLFAAAGAGKMIYDKLAQQRRDALANRKYSPNWKPSLRGRGRGGD